ncbi:ferredoxin-NADP reductase [Actinocorallia herbida]|uniref:Ferredoxin-NADP reductase n=1 Tax=Actinocorallia herbida TaxID=58109 RepID=A0A3N1CVE8_9ACTN|nr:PDR/VanB family oxidoreductase [Actinocorallia herbida]ROO85279.1 ferredoxin-NADP reductase [Actinocorallia herbida]
MSTALKAEITGKEQVADGVCLLTLRPSGGAPEWTPGAHLDLLLGPGLVRQYSLCGDPADRGSLRVAVLAQPDGRGGSLHVHRALEVGGTLEIDGPRNAFPLVEAPGYLFVAGGIGITPLLPMIREVEGRGLPWRLLYGGRTRASMAFADELVALGGERVALRPQDAHGLLDLDAALAEAAEGTAVYACGPEPLLGALEAACSRFPLLDLHTERFTPREIVLDGPDGSFEVELARAGRTITVGAGETLLEALEREGTAPSFSCREGTCGSCETTVLGGTPDHRDSLLTEDEQAAGDVIFPCVSRARSAKLVLDL